MSYAYSWHLAVLRLSTLYSPIRHSLRHVAQAVLMVGSHPAKLINLIGNAVSHIRQHTRCYSRIRCWAREGRRAETAA